MTGRPAQVELAMVCTCAPPDAARGREPRAAVKARLSAGSAEVRPWPVTDATFLSQPCPSPRADMDAHIAGTYLDQWFVIVVDNSHQARMRVVWWSGPMRPRTASPRSGTT